MNSESDRGPRRPADLLTVTEAARLLRVSKMTVYRWVQSGKLTATKIAGSFRVPRADVTALLDDARGYVQGRVGNVNRFAEIDETGWLDQAIRSDGDHRRDPGVTPRIVSGRPAVHALSPIARSAIEGEHHRPTGESDQPDLGSWHEHIGLNYVMAVPGDHRIDAASGRVRAEELTRATGGKGWQQLSTATAGAEHTSYDWLLIDSNPRPDSTSGGELLLVRRPVGNPSELTYYICHSDRPAPLAELVAVAGSRRQSSARRDSGPTAEMGWPTRSGDYHDLTAWWCRAGGRWWWVLAAAAGDLVPGQRQPRPDS